MNVTFSCPNCQQCARAEIDVGGSAIRCPRCAGEITIPPGAFIEGVLRRCLLCPSRELFIRKDFPQRLGAAIVVLGFAASCVSWYLYAIYWTFGILFATALADVLLYAAMGESLTCYRCHAEYRDLPRHHGYRPFDLAIHERSRQEQARRPTSAKPRAERTNAVP